MDTDKQPWPPTALIAQLGITREEWDDMKDSGLPRGIAIAVMFKKAARRLSDERAKR